ncbi:MAG TPA: GNAT family N-acetyltransferase [Kribbellaceae bacterium]
MDISPITPGDAATCAEAVGLFEAVNRHDLPDALTPSATAFTAYVANGWDDDPPAAFTARDADRTLVGVAVAGRPVHENLHMSWMHVNVHPEHRRRGYGTALLERLFEVARADGRRVAGIDGWDSPVTEAFAARHGFERKAVGVSRRQDLTALDWTVLDKLYDEAAAAARDYELVRIAGALPDELLDPMAVLSGSINDAPTDDLDIEDDVFTADRLRILERSAEAREWNLYRVVARRRSDGELAGHTAIFAERGRPHVGHQHDTAVAREHRGHRLGLLLKLDLLRWMRDAEPALGQIDTWNAESNDHMVAVNETLGYRVIGRELQYQRNL